MLTDIFHQKIKQSAEDIASKGYCLFTSTFTTSVFNELEKNFEMNRHLLSPAKIGRGVGKQLNTLVRTDHNIWCEEASGDFSPIHKVFNALLTMCREELFLPIKRYEAQLAVYGPGSFYRKHKDKHLGSPHRLLTMVFYFNDWQPEHRGELCIYKNNQKLVQVQPRANHLVIFKSELEHEVLEAKLERRSISGWLRDDIL